ncbi:MAG TPA: fumarylacetoacetate hydrolase family protein, partial [Terriglobales bacterium]|nr:fumarylacetoacetate hydrolase family protein [Terriglobales bacterium]
MKICHYNNHQAGVVVGDQVYNIGDALIKAGLARQGYTMLEIVDALVNNPAAMQIARDAAQGSGAIALSSVKLHAPIPNPGSLWAAAANYRAHQKEMIERMGSADRVTKTHDELMAEFFLKTTSSIIGPGDTVILPKISKLVDFECELCAVIGKRARRVSENEALDHVFGYMMCWDISQRDPWGKGMQNTRNIRKGFDTFTALGPWIVTKDEVKDPHNLTLTLRVNGEIRQHSNTKNMTFNIPEQIAYWSSLMTLYPGDIFGTGTPAGVALGHKPDPGPYYLKPGDLVEAEIEGVGMLVNRVI